MELNELAINSLKTAQKLKADDSVALCIHLRDKIIRFSNNSITIAEEMDNTTVNMYFAKNGRRTVGATSNINMSSLKEFVGMLERNCTIQKASSEYVPLPKGPFEYSKDKFYDQKTADLKSEAIDLTLNAIDISLKNGATRTAGILTVTEEDIAISTTTNIDATSSKIKILFNIRAFADGSASGQGLSCATAARDFNPEDAALKATELARKAVNPQSWEEGVYDIILAPAVSADIIQLVGSAASAFHIDSGLSFLTDKINDKVAFDGLSLYDFGVTDGGLANRAFDDEGVPTQKTTIIDKGVLHGYLHNTTTAKKWKTKSTGNAGFIVPMPRNLIVEPGSFGFEEMVKQVKKGIYVTSNWYTRFQNYRTGDFSTVPRDAAFLIEGGEIKHPIVSARLSGNILDVAKSIYALSKDRKWIEWWEVSTPTCAPTVLAKDMKATKA